jgi:hypothetical protein
MGPEDRRRAIGVSRLEIREILGTKMMRAKLLSSSSHFLKAVLA